MPLHVDTLQSEIQTAIEDILQPALEQGMLATYTRASDKAKIAAKRFSEVVTEQVAEPMAKSLAAAIDYHVRSADIFGKIITDPVKADIESPFPLLNGIIPNTLGIK